MLSERIPVHEVRRQVLDDNLDKVYSRFGDETEQEISDHHKSESSNEITEENKISQHLEILTLRLIATVCFCLFGLATIFIPLILLYSLFEHVLFTANLCSYNS